MMLIAAKTGTVFKCNRVSICTRLVSVMLNAKCLGYNTYLKYGF